MELGLGHKSVLSSAVWLGNKFKDLNELISIPLTQELRGEIQSEESKG